MIVIRQDTFASQKYYWFISVVAYACSGHGPDQLRLFCGLRCFPTGSEYLPSSFLLPRTDINFRRESLLVNQDFKYRLSSFHWQLCPLQLLLGGVRVCVCTVCLLAAFGSIKYEEKRKEKRSEILKCIILDEILFALFVSEKNLCASFNEEVYIYIHISIAIAVSIYVSANPA